jgi:hypothetical protein
MRLAVTHRSLLAVLALALAAPAVAQQPAPIPEDPRAPRFDEVESGLFAGFETGAIVLLRTPTADPVKYPFAGEDGGRATGLLVGAHLGYDLSERFAASVFALGGNAEAGASYGAFGILATGLDLRLSLWSRPDRNGIDRLHLYVHGRGGWLLTRPEGLFGTSDLYVAGGPGIEYVTRLRHFSVGLAADAIWLPRAGVPGFSLAPTVRYTF